MKAKQRLACVRLRESLDPDVRSRGASRIAEIGIGFAAPHRGSTLSAYCAIGAELNCLPLLAWLAHEGFQTSLPVITPKGHPLVFRAWAPADPLFDRMWGIREPGPEAAVLDPDVLLVPLLAFDAAGWRLGYGGGYYDRTLARLRAMKPVIAIGVAFDEQEQPAVPRGPFDQPLDWILTPSGPRRRLSAE